MSKKLILILAALLLISSTAYAVTWFSISGEWRLKVDGEPSTVTILQDGGDLTFLDSDFPQLKLKGHIWQKLPMKFEVFASKYDTYRRFDGKSCSISASISFSGHRMDSNSLSVHSCVATMSESCGDEVNKGSLSCEGIWTK